MGQGGADHLLLKETGLQPAAVADLLLTHIKILKTKRTHFSEPL